jgi:hypothetical protein
MLRTVLRTPPTTPDGLPLLLGRLRRKRPKNGTPPYLLIDVWCPACGMKHTHGWPLDEGRLDALGHRAAHCRGDDPPFWRAGYWIGLDPAHDEESLRVLGRSRGKG